MSDTKIARTLEKLQTSLKSGDFYSALQLYRTVIKRKADAGNLVEARALLVSGASLLAQHRRVHEALDLGDMLVKVFDKALSNSLDDSEASRSRAKEIWSAATIDGILVIIESVTRAAGLTDIELPAPELSISSCKAVANRILTPIPAGAITNGCLLSTATYEMGEAASSALWNVNDAFALGLAHGQVVSDALQEDLFAGSAVGEDSSPLAGGSAAPAAARSTADASTAIAGPAKAHTARLRALLTFVKACLRWVRDTSEKTQVPAMSRDQFSEAALAAWDAEQAQSGTSKAKSVSLQSLVTARCQLVAARVSVLVGPPVWKEAHVHYVQSAAYSCSGARDVAGHAVSAAAAEISTFAWQWSRLGYAGERDLFLARPVLQLLCLGNLRDANGVVTAFGAREQTTLSGDSAAPAKSAVASLPALPATLETPLTRFVRFLLLTLERDARPLFTALADKYGPALARDPALPGYVQTIGARYYNIQPPQSGLAAMANSLMSLFGGGPGGGKGGLPFPFPGLMGR